MNNVSFDLIWILIMTYSILGLGICIIQLVFLYLKPKPKIPQSRFSAFSSGIIQGYISTEK